MDVIEAMISALLGIFVGIIVGYFVRKNISEAKIGQAEKMADDIIDKAKKDAETLQKEKLLEAKEEIHKWRNEAEKENKERRIEVQKFERRIIQKEEVLDKKLQALENKETVLNDKLKKIEKKEENVEAIKVQQLEKLESISGITSDQAKEIILTNAEREVRREMSIMIKEIESQAKDEADKKSREIIGYAIQKCAADHVAETTVTVVNLPNDEMKGRIIGREGRNIRTLETLTGIDLIIDDTPEAVILSGFDPIRREVARIALEKLIADGRIHPARIEEMVEKARKEVDNIIKEFGEQATFETGVHGLHPELVRLLGRLNYRTSYGQNVLRHSIEVAHIAGIMAAEIGADVKLAKRAGLLHDIGKAVDHEMEGTHVEIGMDLLRRYKESKDVIHAMSTHHGDYEPQTIEAVLVTAADAISAARPGARRETLEAYIKRLEKLEEIANSYDGVDKSFAIQAGREIRIMVKPENVNDEDIHLLARDMTKRIEDELEYPGQIKVSIIRETRAIEYAK
ncbi:MAG: ribonuclease Y [Paraclostridium bifermentans]|uniref:Ribonuclease Y n=3 Tax=Bacillota TaxID=1239 RepID=A0A1X2JE84_PARBF|nr:MULTISPECIES: ribonuclease Y [Paraclostridium]MBN8046527.1 ribonuclease Y [Paraclostridium bifermentans]MBS6509479.1 ribonuclease Y [Paraclostridium bifermentans]MBZ6004932.1 ribonuclease Y [Paraclostridium bifermentans]MCE9674508.1 ribonuclease Y [Paraclostridium bifermentans]MCR1875051.1 ribonuclease Y [Paraclostridium bifermentans]